MKIKYRELKKILREVLEPSQNRINQLLDQIDKLVKHVAYQIPSRRSDNARADVIGKITDLLESYDINPNENVVTLVRQYVDKYFDSGGNSVSRNDISRVRRQLSAALLQTAGDLDTTGDYGRLTALQEELLPEILLWGEDTAVKIIQSSNPEESPDASTIDEFCSRFNIPEDAEIPYYLGGTVCLLVNLGAIRALLDDRLVDDDKRNEYFSSLLFRYRRLLTETGYSQLLNELRHDNNLNNLTAFVAECVAHRDSNTK